MIEALSSATWLWFAYSAFGLTIMAGTMVIHLKSVSRMPSGPWLLVAGALCGAAGCLVAATQAGPNPLFDRATEIAIVRVLWATGITLGIIASALYIYARAKRAGKEGDEQ